MNGMKLVSEHSVRFDGCGHAGSIQNVFNDFICSEVERIDEDELLTCRSPLSLCRKLELCMERNG